MVSGRNWRSDLLLSNVSSQVLSDDGEKGWHLQSKERKSGFQVDPSHETSSKSHRPSCLQVTRLRPLMCS